MNNNGDYQPLRCRWSAFACHVIGCPEHYRAPLTPTALSRRYDSEGRLILDTGRHIIQYGAGPGGEDLVNGVTRAEFIAKRDGSWPGFETSF